MRSELISNRAFSNAIFAAVMLFLPSYASAAVLTELAKLTASDAATNDAFGGSVSISGDTAIVGAWGKNFWGLGSGSAYVFVRSGGVWTEQQQIIASDGAGGDVFGESVAISGETAVVGAWGSGSAYVFVRSGGVWTEQQKLTASDAAAFDYFGFSVAISGDTALVGAYWDDQAGSFSGAVYVFVRSSGMWTEQQKLIASDAASGDQFGISVSISGDIAVVGANRDDDAGDDSGSAYIFKRSGGVWTQEQKLTASDAEADDEFGHSVSISGISAVVGARHEGTAHFTTSQRGSAYVFVGTGGVWTEQQKLTASDAAAHDEFGHSVSISGDAVVVGASGDDTGFMPFNLGSAYVFIRSDGVWTEQQKLTASDAASDDFFGTTVSVSGGTALAGVQEDDDHGLSSGSAYVFDFPSCGNGLLDGAEECDDGGIADGDGCTSTCTVESGYTCDASKPSVCMDINECALGADNCDANSNCTNTPGGFDCTCNKGYEGDGIVCTLVDPCLSNPPLECNDGQFCNGIEICTIAGCTSGQSPCNEMETCNEDTDTCESGAIPTVSGWGLLVMMLLLSAGTKIHCARRRTATAS